jgi:hypothetical protein
LDIFLKEHFCTGIGEMGNGTLYKRGGAWCVNFKTAEGQRVRETVGPNRKIAEKVLSLRMVQVLENRYFPAQRTLGRMPFNEFAQMYIDRVVVPLLKSVRTESNRVKSWIKVFNARPIGELNRSEIEAWRRGRMTTCKPATINRDLSRLRRKLNIAVEWDLLEESPMTGMKFLRENNARTRYLSIEECQRLIDSCAAPHIQAIVTVALHSGMRLGEILNLHWRDIDFQSGFMLIRDSKNGEARPVPMDKTLIALLLLILGEQELIWFSRTPPGVDTPISALDFEMPVTGLASLTFDSMIAAIRMPPISLWREENWRPCNVCSGIRDLQ